ncbi:hypothetical protein Goshw_023982 [Gossypium schwendimanii]|uniref:Uncharacterized protein n=1 Tax=Gossypium schwendimanii TaxID=34291 RepID=A0A7J9LZM1_GOSSC|nr:hypothetical protein [Gossypium schwendimanii]
MHRTVEKNTSVGEGFEGKDMVGIRRPRKTDTRFRPSSIAFGFRS